MDRSCLSDPRVIEASRKFVCARLATYEDELEAKLLTNLFIGRSGKLENTVFALLAPDGRTKLSRTGRSPNMVFPDTDDLVAAMNRIADKYPPARNADPADQPLPVASDVRLALNVAACDNLPLLTVVADSSDDRKRLANAVAPHAWKDPLQGLFVYGAGTSREHADLGIGIIPDKFSGVLVVRPGTYGDAGEVLQAIDAGSVKGERLQEQLLAALKRFRPEHKSQRSHIADGRAKGIDWETAIPVTDPGIPPGARRGERPPQELPPRTRR